MIPVPFGLLRRHWLKVVVDLMIPAKPGKSLLPITLEPPPLFATLAGEFCQGPWNADLETPPGPEGSNGTLLRIRRGHPGIFPFTI
jgi:hypothetical protein